MSESCEEASKNQGDIKCPFCLCEFYHRSDLEKHMKRFGNSQVEHLEDFRKTHARMEHAVSET